MSSLTSTDRMHRLSASRPPVVAALLGCVLLGSVFAEFLMVSSRLNRAEQQLRQMEEDTQKNDQHRHRGTLESLKTLQDQIKQHSMEQDNLNKAFDERVKATESKMTSTLKSFAEIQLLLKELQGERQEAMSKSLDTTTQEWQTKLETIQASIQLQNQKLLDVDEVLKEIQKHGRELGKLREEVEAEHEELSSLLTHQQASVASLSAKQLSLEASLRAAVKLSNGDGADHADKMPSDTTADEPAHAGSGVNSELLRTSVSLAQTMGKQDAATQQLQLQQKQLHSALKTSSEDPADDEVERDHAASTPVASSSSRPGWKGVSTDASSGDDIPAATPSVGFIAGKPRVEGFAAAADNAAAAASSINQDPTATSSQASMAGKPGVKDTITAASANSDPLATSSQASVAGTVAVKGSTTAAASIHGDPTATSSDVSLDEKHAVMSDSRQFPSLVSQAHKVDAVANPKASTRRSAPKAQDSSAAVLASESGKLHGLAASASLLWKAGDAPSATLSVIKSEFSKVQDPLATTSAASHAISQGAFKDKSDSDGLEDGNTQNHGGLDHRLEDDQGIQDALGGVQDGENIESIDEMEALMSSMAEEGGDDRTNSQYEEDEMDRSIKQDDEKDGEAMMTTSSDHTSTRDNAPKSKSSVVAMPDQEAIFAQAAIKRVTAANQGKTDKSNPTRHGITTLTLTQKISASQQASTAPITVRLRGKDKKSSDGA